MPKARAAALTALQIDDTLAEAHTSLALTNYARAYAGLADTFALMSTW